MKPCYRVCLWDKEALRWRPHVTRTRRLLKTLRGLKLYGLTRPEVWAELRPGRGIPMPMPDAPGPAAPKLFVP